MALVAELLVLRKIKVKSIFSGLSKNGKEWKKAMQEALPDLWDDIFEDVRKGLEEIDWLKQWKVNTLLEKAKDATERSVEFMIKKYIKKIKMQEIYDNQPYK